MKLRIIALLLTIAAVFSIGTASAGSNETYLDYVQDRTVLVERDCKDTSKNGWGTGVIIDSNRVVTAAHVVDDREGCDFLIRRKKEGSYPALVMKEDAKHDLALLTVSHDYGISTQIAPSKLGEELTVVGYPVQYFDSAEQYISITQGILTTKNVRINGERRWVDRISALVNFGNSGGPAFNGVGQVVGIVILMHTNAQGYFYIARAVDLQVFLDGE